MAPDVSFIDSNRNVALWQGFGGILSFGFCWCVLLVCDVICCGVCSDAGCALLTRPAFCCRFFQFRCRVRFAYPAYVLLSILWLFACKQAPTRLCYCFWTSVVCLLAGGLIRLDQLFFVFDVLGIDTAAPACWTQAAAASLACCRHCCSGLFWLSACRK